MVSRFRPLIPLYAGLLLVACGGDSDQHGAAPVATQAASAGPGEVPIEEVLAKANAAFEAKRLFDPPEDIALTLFVEVIERKDAGEADPAARRRLMDSVASSSPQQRAQSALNDLLPFGLNRVNQALRAGELNDAERILKLLERAHPDAGSVQRLRSNFAAAHAAARAALKSTDYDALPPLLSKSMPTYPPRAERKGIEGWVHVSFEIQPDGSVDNVKVMAGEPERIFDKAAVAAVELWRFQPPGRAIPAQRRIEFTLNSDE